MQEIVRRGPRSRSANVCGVPEENPENKRRDQARMKRSGMPVDPGEGPEQVPTPDPNRPAGDDRDLRAKERALRRLHGASDEILAVFEQNLRDDASAAGASEQEIRDAQSQHPEHP
jgi:hypothetical protein